MVHKSPAFRRRPQPPTARGRGQVAARTARLAVAMTMMVATGAACGGGPADRRAGPAGAEAGGRTGGQLVWAKPVEAEFLDPATSSFGASWEVLHLAYDRLVGLDDQVRPVPELAESWRQTSPTTYEFTLREGVKFSNGREMTADDVVGSLERVMDPKVKSHWATQLGIKEVEAAGATRVTVTLDKPKTSFVPALAGSPAAIMPMRELAAKSFDPKKELLGTGPYRVVSHSQNESWTFERNPHYWRPGTAKPDRVVIRIMPDDAARTAALRDGSVHVTTFDAPDSVRLLKDQPGIKTTVLPTTDYYRLDINGKTSIFRDARLRQAVALSIDRRKIVDVALGGIGRPTAAVGVSFAGVCDPARLPYAVPDPQRARQLVQQAGATGKSVTFVVSTSTKMHSPIAQVLQQNLQAAGLKVQIKPTDPGEVAKDVYSGKPSDFGLNIGSYTGFADPAMVLPWWNPELAGFNLGFLEPDPRLNELIEGTATSAPGQRRTTMMRDACARIAQNANVLPVVTKDAIIAYRTDKVVPKIQAVEAYAIPLRRIAEFSVK